MRHARRAGKRDANEPEIVSIAESYGWTVEHLDTFDLLCWRGTELMAVEVKNGHDKKLTDYQKRLKARGCPLIVVHTAEEAKAVFE